MKTPDQMTNDELIAVYVNAVGGAKAEYKRHIMLRMKPHGDDVVVNHLVTVRKGELAGELRGEDVEKVLEAMEFELDEGEGYHVAEDKYIYPVDGGYELDGFAWGDFQRVVLPGKTAFRDAFTSKAA